jgi:hypothetical protein
MRWKKAREAGKGEGGKMMGVSRRPMRRPKGGSVPLTHSLGESMNEIGKLVSACPLEKEERRKLKCAPIYVQSGWDLDILALAMNGNSTALAGLDGVRPLGDGRTSRVG